MTITENSPYWARLLHTWEKDKAHNGLSIPFLVGARTLVDRHYQPTIADARALFDEIPKSDYEGFEIFVFRCTKMGTILLSIDEANDSLRTTTNLKFGMELVGAYGNNSDRVIDKILTEDIKHAIDRGLYSRQETLHNCLKWEPYTDEHKEFIIDCLSNAITVS